ncbi:MAG: O-antigen ligase family protein [Terriglobales bacterium]
MTLILILDLLAVTLLCQVAMVRGFERTLPVAAFLLIIFPNESQIQVPGLFDLTTQRIVVVALLLLYLVLGKAPGESKARDTLPLKYLFIVQIVWWALSSVNSVVVGVSVKTVLSQLLDFYLVYFIFAKSITRVETIHKILYAVVLAMFVCSMFGAVEAYRGWSVLSLFPPVPHRFNYGVDFDRGIRVQATFGHAILYGGALAMAIPMALYLMAVAKTTARKVFLWSAIVLMFLNIYKTASRGPWIAAILSVAPILLCGGKRMRRYVLVISLLTATVLIARPGVWESISNLYGETLNPDTAQGESYQWRYALYNAGFQHLNKDAGRAMWGYGPESFYYLGWKGEFQGHIVPFESCDSSFAAMMIETGYVGVLITVVLLMKAAYLTLRNFLRTPSPESHIYLLFLVNLGAFYFMMTNVAIFGWGQQSYMLWLVLAMSLVCPRLGVSKRARKEDPAHVAEFSPTLSYAGYASLQQR